MGSASFTPRPDLTGLLIGGLADALEPAVDEQPAPAPPQPTVAKVVDAPKQPTVAKVIDGPKQPTVDKPKQPKQPTPEALAPSGASTAAAVRAAQSARSVMASYHYYRNGMIGSMDMECQIPMDPAHVTGRTFDVADWGKVTKVEDEVGTFRDELLHTSRAALSLVVEHLVELLVDRSGRRGTDARNAVLTVLGQSLGE